MTLHKEIILVLAVSKHIVLHGFWVIDEDNLFRSRVFKFPNGIQLLNRSWVYVDCNLSWKVLFVPVYLQNKCHRDLLGLLSSYEPRFGRFWSLVTQSSALLLANQSGLALACSSPCVSLSLLSHGNFMASPPGLSMWTLCFMGTCILSLTTLFQAHLAGIESPAIQSPLSTHGLNHLFSN